MSRIYFDTTPLIYFLDDEKPFSDKVARFLSEHQNEDDLYFTSTITDAEYLAFPYKMNDGEKIAQYGGIKGMDALHLATCIHCGCDIFLTNDSQLKQVLEANVVLVDDL